MTPETEDPDAGAADLAQKIAEAIVAEYSVGTFAEGSDEDNVPDFYAADAATLAEIIRMTLAAEAPI